MTPVDVDKFIELLEVSQYDKIEINFLKEGFTHGFDLGYRGPEEIKQTSKNLRFTIGNETELWNKVMKEVKENRYAGPFSQIPFENYIQSPIGLVPKDQGKKTRLIFHLSHPRNAENGISVNGNTPKELTSVNYSSFDDAVKLCLKQGKGCFVGKSDMSSAFRHFPMNKKFWKYLVMKAKSPIDGKWYYFVDKCMPFGASISCSHFQRFSDAVAHVVTYITKSDNINYLDDFFFAALLKFCCDRQIHTFLQVCEDIKFPVSMEKTFWGTNKLTFLGLLIDTVNQLICVPTEKLKKASDLIHNVLEKNSNKIRLDTLQQITGFLNFLSKAVVPGRTFTRRLYHVEERAIQKDLKQHHHINFTAEMRMDLQMWQAFLENPNIFARPFLDLDDCITSEEVDFYTDASANPELGCGGISQNDWFIMQWNEKFITKKKPSINYLELYAVTVAISLWIHKFKNRRIFIFCDNMSVVQMINSATSKCKNCMVLLRYIVLYTMAHNVKVNVKHVPGKQNKYSDYLSRMQYDKFRKEARKERRNFSNKPAQIPEVLWPMDKLWLSSNKKSTLDFNISL